MACIKSAPRSALAAFAPDAPYLAAGTMAGAVDLSFSSSANLEIFKLDFQSDSQELPVVGGCPSSDRFNRLSWGKPKSGSTEYSLGLIAGGLGDGTIGVWNPAKLISPEGNEDAFVVRLEKHTGPVRGLEFNPHEPKLLASGADEGELCIWDLENPPEPKRFPSLKSVGSGSQTEISFVSWNVKYQHILASTSLNGIAVVWDLRQQKPLTSFLDPSKRRCSVLQWNPEVSTQLIVASDDDSSPALKVWDVRKTISPVREFVGHTKGVIAMSWCPYESSLLLTCAKDNRTICWDTNTGEIHCELPASTNWNFDIHWHPKIPGVISASSFDVKLGIYNIEACNKLVSDGNLVPPVRLRAPKWLNRPAGASFGFGGKLATFHPSQAAPGASSSTSEVHLHNLVTEDSLVNRSAEFEAAIQSGERNSLRALCGKKSQNSLSDDEKEVWAFLKVMFEEDGTARTKLLTHLGFRVPNVESDITTDELGKEFNETLSFEDNIKKGTIFKGGDASLPIDNEDEFFNNPQPSDEVLVEEEVFHDEKQDLRVIEPTSDSDSSIDESIQSALVVGDYKEAVRLCMSANRVADALVIAHVGGSSLWEGTRDKYLQSSLTSYLKIVAAMATNDLMTLVSTRPLNSWKETLALLCTFAQKEEWIVLCDTLGSRLLTVGNTLAATLCYICSGNIDKIVEIWSRSLMHEQDGRSYVDLLQDIMEKIIVLSLASGQKRLSKSLSKLVENYAELLASQGLLSTAMEYLKLLGSEDSSLELTLLQERIALCTEERGITGLPYEESPQQHNHVHNIDGSTSSAVNGSQHYYQDNAQVQQQSTSSGQYADGYQQNLGSYGGYPTQVPQQGQQFLGYTNPVQYQPTQSSFQQTQSSFKPTQSSFQPTQSSFQPTQSSFQPTQSSFQPTQSSFQPTQSSFQPTQSSFQPTQSSFQPTQSSFQPTQSSFQPIQSSFQPTQSSFQSTQSSFQPTQSPHMFIPSQTHQVPQQNYGQPPASAQPVVRPFVPTNPPALRNADQYQQPHAPGSQLYPGVPSQNYQTGAVSATGPPQPGSVPGHRFPQPGTASAPRSFMPATSSFGHTAGFNAIQPSSPTQKVQQPVTAPPAPPPTVQTVDTSKVSAELRPVIGTLTRLYQETSEALGGQRANPAKKREIEDNSRKIGALFVKLNSGDISLNASSKLRQLCQALDTGDFASALHIQVLLTTSDWDECNFWLAALKRMIKTRQNVLM